MKFKLFCYLLIISFLFSCGNPASSDDNDKQQDENKNTETFIGKWYASSLLKTRVFTENSFTEEVDTNTYTWKGSLTYTNDTLTTTEEFVRESETGDWLSLDFDSKFKRDLESYNEYLISKGFTEMTSDEFWVANHEWSIERFKDPYVVMGPYYGGYKDGMTVEEYKVAARADYTSRLTRTFQWEIRYDELVLKEDKYTTFYTKIE